MVGLRRHRRDGRRLSGHGPPMPGPLVPCLRPKVGSPSSSCGRGRPPAGDLAGCVLACILRPPVVHSLRTPSVDGGHGEQSREGLPPQGKPKLRRPPQAAPQPSTTGVPGTLDHWLRRVSAGMVLPRAHFVPANAGVSRGVARTPACNSAYGARSPAGAPVTSGPTALGATAGGPRPGRGGSTGRAHRRRGRLTGSTGSTRSVLDVRIPAEFEKAVSRPVLANVATARLSWADAPLDVRWCGSIPARSAACVTNR